MKVKRAFSSGTERQILTRRVGEMVSSLSGIGMHGHDNIDWQEGTSDGNYFFLKSNNNRSSYNIYVQFFGIIEKKSILKIKVRVLERTRE